MKIKTIVFTAIVFLLSATGYSQTATPKEIKAKRTTERIKIDGLIDEAAWKDAPMAKGYTEFRPTPFRAEDPANRTEVYMLYDDEGIYLGGYCHEKTKDSISSELNGRDGFGNNDFIGFIFDTYEDKINGFEYFVTPLGEQMDAKMSPNPNGNSEDFTWNAVWKSAAVIHSDGWSFEMFLPFSAIRFSKKNVQDWGLNITRRRQKTGQQVAWNPVDPNVNGFLTQEGTWKGLENIKPPLRLQFSPYFSTSTNHYYYHDPAQKDWTYSVNGGMDVKYGINQAFTLDLTLIPDFGQVPSDKRVLNLTPFETKYTENRPFFTEGTELFSKGNLFYPRRIGLDPVLLHSADEYLTTNEIVEKDPQESKLINAIKISGRTVKGLGIGVLNAVTNTRYATLEDTVTGARRKVVVDPLTNYNIIVLNQSLKYNSSISLVNSNVWRSGNDYDANVTAGLFDFNDKKNTWNGGGKLSNSRLIGYLPGGKTQSGYNHSIYFGKTSGRFSFNVKEDLMNDKFYNGDFGYFNYNNTFDHTLYVGYRWIKPHSFYNNIYLNFNALYSRQLTPAKYRNANINANVNGQLKNLWSAGALIGYEPKYNDFFEAHTPGRVFSGWSDYFLDGWFQTNSSKKYYMYNELLYVDRSLFHSKRYQYNMNQHYRFNTKFSISHSLYLEPQKDNTGYATIQNSDIIFGRRDISTVENTLGIKYSFSDKMYINVNVRHYWSQVRYKEFFSLLNSGKLQPNPGFNGNEDQNYNDFTLDATYTWQFGPGSFIYLIWRNASESFDSNIDKDYFPNFKNTTQVGANNNVSFKIVYFLDYLQFKNLKKKKVKSENI